MVFIEFLEFVNVEMCNTDPCPSQLTLGAVVMQIRDEQRRRGQYVEFLIIDPLGKVLLGSNHFLCVL